MLEARVVTVRQVNLRVGPGSWQHEAGNEDAIAAFWTEQQQRNPALFDGRFFVLDRWQIDEEGLHGVCRETRYAAYLHWRADGFTSAGLNAFAMPVVRSRDGAVLIGRMAGWTANAGIWYMPAGSIDAADVLADGSIDLEGNISRELQEEIGLSIEPHQMSREWALVFVRGRLAMFREIRLAISSRELLELAGNYLAQEEKPELDALKLVTRQADYAGLQTPPFLSPYLELILPA